jgi:hypothetical protein
MSFSVAAFGLGSWGWHMWWLENPFELQPAGFHNLSTERCAAAPFSPCSSGKDVIDRRGPFFRAVARRAAAKVYPVRQPGV